MNTVGHISQGLWKHPENTRHRYTDLEFWQAETLDIVAIDRELAWAAALGMNAVRVYLHDLLWFQDPKAFTARIDLYLATAFRHGIRSHARLLGRLASPSPSGRGQG